MIIFMVDITTVMTDMILALIQVMDVEVRLIFGLNFRYKS